MNWLQFCLEDTHLLIIQTPLAEAIGLNEAIFVRQLNYWINNRDAVQLEGEGDKWWIYSSYKRWREHNFRFWSERTIRRVIAGLIEAGIVLQKRRTNKDTGAEEAPYYTLNLELLDKVLSDYFEENPDAAQFYLGKAPMDKKATPDGQKGHPVGEGKKATPDGQKGHQRDLEKENQKKKENQKDISAANAGAKPRKPKAVKGVDSDENNPAHKLANTYLGIYWQRIKKHYQNPPVVYDDFRAKHYAQALLIGQHELKITGAEFAKYLDDQCNEPYFVKQREQGKNGKMPSLENLAQTLHIAVAQMREGTYNQGQQNTPTQTKGTSKPEYPRSRFGGN